MGSNWGQIPIVLMFKEHAGYLMDSASPDHVVSQLLMSSEFGAFEISVKVLVWTDHQQFDGVFFQDAVGEQAHQVTHAKLVNQHASQITHFGFPRFGLARDGFYRLVKRRFFAAGATF